MSDFAAAYGMKRKKYTKSPISGNMDIPSEDDMVADIMNKRAAKNSPDGSEPTLNMVDELNEDALGKENYDEVELNQPEADPNDMISSIRSKLNMKRQFSK